MQITFSPTRSDQTLSLSKSGDVLYINGEAFDFSGIPDGASLPCTAVACDWLVSDVTRVDGTLHLTLVLPLGPNAPKESLLLTSLDAADGEIVLPSYHRESNA